MLFLTFISWNKWTYIYSYFAKIYYFISTRVSSLIGRVADSVCLVAYLVGGLSILVGRLDLFIFILNYLWWYVYIILYILLFVVSIESDIVFVTFTNIWRYKTMNLLSDYC